MRAGLAVLEGPVTDRHWLEGEAATIADLACCPYLARADEGGVALAPDPAVRVWIERFADLPACQTMPGLEIP